MTNKTIRVYSTNFCPYCVQAKKLLSQLKLPFDDISLEGKQEERMRLSKENGGWRTVPMIFVGDQFIGGFTELVKFHKNGNLEEALK